MNAEIWTIIGTGIAVISFIYMAIRNFRTDLDNRFEKMEKYWIETNKRMDGVYHVLLKRIKEE